jgi:DNA ligase-1
MKPMLAAKADETRLKFPYAVSVKLDGIRALVLNGVLVSRNLKPIPNESVQHQFGRAEFNGLDGELIVGDPWGTEVFRRTTSGVMSRDGVPNASFYVFDCFRNPRHPWSERFPLATSIAKPWRNSRLWALTHTMVHTPEELTDSERCALEQGYEGLMLRDPRGPYKFGRSTVGEGHLLKLKRFHDDEAIVIGVEALEHNENEQTRDELGRSKRSSHKAGKRAAPLLGNLLVRARNGTEFSIGSGFTLMERADLWRRRRTLPGLIVKYRFFPTGAKERPRFPTFLGFRDVRDL